MSVKCIQIRLYMVKTQIYNVACEKQYPLIDRYVGYSKNRIKDIATYISCVQMRKKKRNKIEQIKFIPCMCLSEPLILYSLLLFAAQFE